MKLGTGAHTAMIPAFLEALGPLSLVYEAVRSCLKQDGGQGLTLEVVLGPANAPQHGETKFKNVNNASLALVCFCVFHAYDVCVAVGTQVTQCSHGGRSTAFWSQFSPFPLFRGRVSLVLPCVPG